MQNQTPHLRPNDDSPEWLDFYQRCITPFWQQVASRQFKAADGALLHWCFYKVDEASPLVVISPGRIEATLKYQEVIWELARAGISCAVIDHRGQGSSQRLTGNPHQGHVDSFDDFVADFALFDTEVGQVFPNVRKRWLVGHSMGGAIATQFLHQRPHDYQQLVLSSPMFSIHTGGIPLTVAKAFAGAGAWLNRKLAPDKPWYFVGMGDYNPLTFEENDLTHSKNRYQVFRQLYQQQPEVQLGGPTFNWLYEALKACEQTKLGALTLRCPVTLFQAGADAVVSAAGQNYFTQHNDNVEKVIIDGARHELLMESDQFRQPLIDKLLSITS